MDLLQEIIPPGVHGKGKLYGFSISMIAIAKLFRLLGVDSIHGGVLPLAKMEDYGEAAYITRVLQDKNLKPHNKIPSLGQDWYHIKPVWMTASGGLHPGDFEGILNELGEDIIIQCGGGLLGHPDGVEAGVKAIEQARGIYQKGIPLKNFVKDNPKSELAAAVKLWGYGPKIVLLMLGKFRKICFHSSIFKKTGWNKILNSQKKKTLGRMGIPERRSGKRGESY